MAKLMASIFLALVAVSLAAPAPVDVEEHQGNQDHGRVRRHYDGGLAGYGGGFGGVGYGGHEGHGGHGHGVPAIPISSSQSYSKSSASASSVSGSVRG